MCTRSQVLYIDGRRNPSMVLRPYCGQKHLDSLLRFLCLVHVCLVRCDVQALYGRSISEVAKPLLKMKIVFFSAYTTSVDCAPVTRLLARHSCNEPAAPRPVNVEIDIRSCVGGQTFWLLNFSVDLKKTSLLSQHSYRDLISVISVCFG